MNGERKFLHDISSPVTSLQLDLENAIGILEEGVQPQDVQDCLGLLRNGLNQVKRSAMMIRERREQISQEEEK